MPTITTKDGAQIGALDNLWRSATDQVTGIERPWEYKAAGGRARGYR